MNRFLVYWLRGVCVVSVGLGTAWLVHAGLEAYVTVRLDAIAAEAELEESTSCAYNVPAPDMILHVLHEGEEIGVITIPPTGPPYWAGTDFFVRLEMSEENP